MKKIFFFFILTITFLNADSIYHGRCVKDIVGLEWYYLIYYNNNYDTYEYEYIFDDTLIPPIINSIDKFEYVDGSCKLVSKNTTLGMSNEQFNFLMALSGLFTSILLVFIIYRKV